MGSGYSLNLTICKNRRIKMLPCPGKVVVDAVAVVAAAVADVRADASVYQGR